MPSHQLSIPVSSCVAQRNASTPSTCSTPDPIAPGTSARLASVPIRSPQEGELAHPPRLGGAVVPCPMRMPCHLLCWAWRGTLKSCDVSCGTARSCPRMMTCGSPCAFCVYTSRPISPPIPFLKYLLLYLCLAVRASSSFRQRWGLSYLRQIAMCVLFRLPTPQHRDAKT